MARNEEKSQATLNRYLAGKKGADEEPPKKRPYLTTECDDLMEAEKWRLQVLREISRKVSEIQNSGLGEHRIRDLNDEINKLIREKGHWERRVVELGGPDYAKSAPQITDSKGFVVQGGRGTGYKYFGAAKNLPGVKELFEAPQLKAVRRTRYDIFKTIDPDYYGFRDEDDGILNMQEKEFEEQKQLKEIERQMEKMLQMQKDMEKATEIVTVKGSKPLTKKQKKENQFVAYVPLPDQGDIDKWVSSKSKLKDLKNKYATQQMQDQQDDIENLMKGK